MTEMSRMAAGCQGGMAGAARMASRMSDAYGEKSSDRFIFYWPSAAGGLSGRPTPDQTLLLRIVQVAPLGER